MYIVCRKISFIILTKYQILMTNKLKIIDIVLLSTYTETLKITEHLY